MYDNVPIYAEFTHLVHNCEWEGVQEQKCD